MILVDSSVWIDYFRGDRSVADRRLDELLGAQSLLIGDIILTEVLQGFSRERDFNTARDLMSAFPMVAIGGEDIAVRAAHNFRILRAKGITVRKTIDTLIATRCIQSDHALLYSDRDFDPFVTHLGLQSALI